jgi:hypothetical protein
MMASFVPTQPHQQMLPMLNTYMQHNAMYALGQPHPQHFMANQGMHGVQQQQHQQQLLSDQILSPQQQQQLLSDQILSPQHQQQQQQLLLWNQSLVPESTSSQSVVLQQATPATFAITSSMR